ncbi:MAG: UvrD-helicase domain-containing protein [Burkholderiaceae bacterium]
MGGRLLDSHPVFDAGILRGFQLLESDAGTGKTWSIAGLVVRAIVEEGLEIDRILVVTFTNAATAELATRIRERIEQMIAVIEAGGDDPGFEPDLFCIAYLPRLADRALALRRLRIARARIDEASVRTIHGFCQRVIESHGLSIGLTGALQAGEGDGRWLREAVAAWWRKEVVAAPPPVAALLTETRIDPERLAQWVAAIHANPGAERRPPEIDRHALAGRLAALRTRFAEVLPEQGPVLLDWLSQKGRVNGRMIRRDWADVSLRALADWATALAGQAMAGRERADFVKQVHRLSTERFEAAVLAGMPASDLPGLCSDLYATLVQAGMLSVALAEEVWNTLHGQRRRHLAEGGQPDFDDLLAIVDEALAESASGPALAAALRERYPLALVDECQDTDARQWAIFRRIHLDTGPTRPEAPGGLVLVGDPKQAIYAFRGADVYSYLAASRAGPQRHVLRENQRSVPALIAAVNSLFEPGDAFGVPGIDFAPARVGARRRRALAGPAAPAAVSPPAPLTVLRIGAGPEGELLDNEQACAAAAAAVVAEIVRLLEQPLRLDERPVAASDCAVLVDSHWQGSLVKRLLADAGIGAVEVSREPVVATAEAEVLSRWLAAVAEPGDDALLRAALLTLPCGLDAAGLAALAAEPVAWGRWAAHFGQCRDTWVQAGAQAALRRLLFDTGAAARLAGLRDGERRLTNLLHLFELIAGADEAAQGPRQAWRWLARARSGGADGHSEVLELRLDSDERLVRILTVHKSKGLEFPFVFLPFVWRGRSPSPAAPFVHHEGPASLSGTAPDWRAVLELAEPPLEPARAQRAFEQRAEAMRLLYVALTRAEQRCCLVWAAAASAAESALAQRLAALPGSSLAGAWADAGPADKRAAERAELATAPEAWLAAAPAGSLALVDVARPAEARPAEAWPAGQPGPVARVGSAAQAAVAGPVAPTGPATALPREPRLRPFTARIPAPWLRTSFSALVERLTLGDEVDRSGFTTATDDEQRDHDQVDRVVAGEGDEVAPGFAGTDPRVAGADIRFSFPAGTRAGSCLHGILEHFEAGTPLDRRRVARQLVRAGFHDPAPEGVAAWLDEVLAADLTAVAGHGFSLRDVAADAKLMELDFLLPGHGVDDAAVLGAIASEYPLDAVVAGSHWTGFLRGFIDLVFEHDGRWYVLDWKSNHLGGAPDDYAAPGIAAAMAAHAYPVQLCLYLLVLHRLLRKRLADYDWDRHVGGAFWVFLRGAGLAGQPVGTGIHASKPSRALIERLDALFDGAGS